MTTTLWMRDFTQFWLRGRTEGPHPAGVFRHGGWMAYDPPADNLSRGVRFGRRSSWFAFCNTGASAPQRFGVLGSDALGEVGGLEETRVGSEREDPRDHLGRVGDLHLQAEIAGR